jgi:hypothetical protein
MAWLKSFVNIIKSYKEKQSARKDYMTDGD